MAFHLLREPVLRANKLVGLGPLAVQLFHATIQAQLDGDYSPGDFDRYLAGIYNYSSAELMRMGTVFEHR